MKRGKIIGNLNASYNSFEWRTINKLLDNGLDIRFVSDNSNDKRIYVNNDVWKINSEKRPKEMMDFLKRSESSSILNLSYILNYWEKIEILIAARELSGENLIMLDENNFWVIARRKDYLIKKMANYFSDTVKYVYC